MAILSVKEFPEDLLVSLKIKAAQERRTLREVVIDELSRITGEAHLPRTGKESKGASSRSKP